jgi:hypothetical protein
MKLDVQKNRKFRSVVAQLFILFFPLGIDTLGAHTYIAACLFGCNMDTRIFSVPSSNKRCEILSKFFFLISPRLGATFLFTYI